MTSLVDTFAYPISVEGALRVPRSADEVWTLIGDLSGAGLIEGMVERVEVSGSGAGAIRSLVLPGDAGAVVERIEEYDAAQRYYIYRVIDSGPVDLASYLALVRVQPAGPGQSIASWISKGQAVDGKADEIRALLRGNIDVVFAGIRRHFGFE